MPLYDEPLLYDEELLYDEREVEVLRDELLLRSLLVVVCPRFTLVVRPVLVFCWLTVASEREPVAVPRPTEPLRCCSNAVA